MSDLDMLKDIPGYKAILKSVLKSQIQLLIEQLAENTGEESIILTASVNDGTLSHLGSNTGKGFLEGRDEIKSQFLGYCLKTHHKKKSEPRPSPYQRPNNHSSSPSINNMTGSSGPLVKPAQKRPRVHPVALQRAGDDSPIHATGSSPTIHPGNSIHSMSPVSSDVKQEGGDSRLLGTMSPTFTSTPSSFPSSLQLSHTQTSTPGNNGDPGPSAEGGGVGIRHSADESNDSSATNIKIEPITENEMELEITGVEPGNSGISEGWDPTQSGYSGVGSGDDSLSQGADQAGYNFICIQPNTPDAETVDLTDDVSTEPVSSFVPPQHYLPLVPHFTPAVDASGHGFNVVDVSSLHYHVANPSPQIPSFLVASSATSSSRSTYMSPSRRTSSRPRSTATATSSSIAADIIGLPISDDLSQVDVSQLPASLPINPKACVKFNKEFYGRSKSRILLKRYICQICGKRLLKKSDLERHIRVHTGEKPYKCTMCYRSYSQKRNLVIHTEKHYRNRR